MKRIALGNLIASASNVAMFADKLARLLIEDVTDRRPT